MKLQLYSQTIREGESHKAVFNGGEAARGIIDVRIGSLFAFPADFSQTVTMLSMTTDGCYLYEMTPLTSRVGDYRALVLFIPRQLLIAAASDIPGIHAQMRQTLQGKGDNEQLRPFFEREYDALDMMIDSPELPKGYAYVEDDKGLILGKPLIQTVLLEYEGVFLLTHGMKKMVKQGAMSPLAVTRLGVRQLALHPAPGHGDTTAVSAKSGHDGEKAKARPSKEKSGKSYGKFLWGLLAGLLVGIAIGYAVACFCSVGPVSPKQPSQVVIPDTLPNDTLPGNSPADGNVSIDGEPMPTPTSPADGSEPTVGEMPTGTDAAESQVQYP